MAGRTTKPWRRTAWANALVLTVSLTALALHQSGPAPVAADKELSVEEGLRLIAGQTGSYSFFLTFEGATNVPRGESNTPTAGAISVRAFSLGAENPIALGSATSGAGTGKVKFNEVKIAKAVDSSSPAIFANLASGGHMRQATLVVRRAGVTTAADYLLWQFGTVYFSKVEWSGEGDGLTEHVTMSYGSLRISYARTSSTGTLSPPVTTQWNQVTNTPVYAAQ